MRVLIKVAAPLSVEAVIKDVFSDVLAISGKQELGLEMVQDALRRADMGGKYSHPDIKDIYDEPPLVVEEDWQKLLGLLGFSEKEVAKDLWELYDEHKKPLFRYEGQYDKVMMFDFLEGMLFEKNERKYDE